MSTVILLVVLPVVSIGGMIVADGYFYKKGFKQGGKK